MRADDLGTDPAELHPELGQVRALVRSRDWDGLESALGVEDDADVLGPAMDVVVATEGSDGFVRDAAARHPGSALAGTLLGVQLTKLAWDVRSSRQADQVSRAQFEEFFDLLRKAEQRLIEVCGRHPAFTGAWLARLTTARGLQLGSSETRRRYDRLARLQPHSYRAQEVLLQQLCPKWGGTWDEAFGFARACWQSAPPGASSGALVPIVWFEQYVELGEKPGRRRLTAPEVRDELVRAADASVFHPAHRRDFAWADAHSNFALAHSMAGDHRAAARHFQALGDAAALGMWRYFGDGADRFAKHRAAALKTVKRQG